MAVGAEDQRRPLTSPSFPILGCDYLNLRSSSIVRAIWEEAGGLLDFLTVISDVNNNSTGGRHTDLMK